MRTEIMLEELKEAYGTEWTTTLINIMSNEQKKVINSMPIAVQRTHSEDE